MKKRLFLSSLLGGLFFSVSAQESAYVQVIHNSPDPLAATVDLYVEQGNVISKLEDVPYRSASPYLELETGVATVVYIAPATSTSKADAVFNKSLGVLTAGDYVAVASGTVSAGFMPAQPLDIYVSPARRIATSEATNTDVLVFHGSTDAPSVDVAEKTAGTLAEDVSYGAFKGYLELPTANYTLIVKTADGVTNVKAYLAPLQTLALQGQSITVLASGFLDPSMNNGGASFGLFAVTAGGAFVELPTAQAGVQIIHNSPDAAAAIVDLYVTVGAVNPDTIKLDNVAFRTATEFLALPAELDITVAVAAASSTSYADNIAEIPLGKLDTYSSNVIVASGLVSPTGYTPTQPFELKVYSDFEEASGIGQTKLLVLHGSTDAPTVGVTARGVGELIEELSYGEFSQQLEVPAADYTLDITASGATVASYSAPLSAFGGQALVVLASGFLDPAQNSSGPAFGLYVATEDGGPLLMLPSVTTAIRDNMIQGGFDIYPNPASNMVSINGINDFRYAEIINQNGVAVKTVNTATFSVEDLNAGVYAIKVFTDQKTYVSKLAKD